jgi:hypothetical protein
MWIVKKYKKKKRLKEMIFHEYEVALEKRDYIRTGILSKRFIKITKL